MDFTHPERLWLLMLIPGLILWVARHRHVRAADWSALGRDTIPRGDRAWRWVWASLLLTIALAGPRWGRLPGSELPPGHDVVLLVDASRSMGAEDAVPSRLGVAVECGEGLIKALGRESGSRAAVVAFAGRGVLRCPLTENLGAAGDALKAIRAGDVRPGGTNLASALETALDAFDELEPAEGRTIVLFTDGEDHAGTWNQVVPRLEAAKVIVHAVAIGDAEQGHPIPLAEGRSQPLQYHGETVLSRRQDAPLATLTTAAGGALLRVGLASAELETLYETRIAPIASRKRDALRAPERVERYSVFVLGAFMFGLSGSWAGLRRVPVLAFTLMFAALGAGPAGQTPGSLVEAGNAYYAAGDYPRAHNAFQQAVSLDSHSAIAHYNAGAALFQLGRYPEAEASYREARGSAGAGLRMKIDYALGNLAVLQRQFADAVRRYDACLESQVPGQAFDSIRRDAGVNREYAARRRPPPDDTTSGGPRPAPRQSTNPDDQENDTRAQDDSNSPSSPSAAGKSAPNSSQTPRRAQGDEGNDRGKSSAQSPDAQLDDALRNAREARQRRLTDEPSSVPDEERKDW